MSHLHFDHAGGLLRADGSRAFPRATIVAQRAEWEIALGDNPRLVASYDQPELRLVADWGAEGWADGERELLPGRLRRSGPAATPRATRRSSCAGPGPGARTLAFFGDLCMRPWAANPRWVTAFDDFPLDCVAVKGELFRRAVEEDWIVVLSHESRMPVGRWSATATGSGSRGCSATAPHSPGSHASTRAVASACERGPLTTSRIRPSGAMKNCVGRANTRYRRKMSAYASKAIG